MTLDEAAPLVAVTCTLTGLIVGGIDFLIRKSVMKHRDTLVKELSEKVVALQMENANLRVSLNQAVKHEELLKQQLEDVGTALSIEKKCVDALAQEKSELMDRLGALEEVALSLETGRKAHDNRIRRALKLEGTIWTQQPMTGVPAFRPLAERRTPIVSVLNLKGGVGKTTLTAYLGWALSRLGYRVLLIDLDLQGSLSSLFIPQDELAELGCKDEHLLRGFLAQACKDRKTKLCDYALPSAHLAADSRIVATTDRLAYAELNLTVQWLLRIGGNARAWNGAHDSRMILRRSLHSKAVSKQFDVVLLDCPPLVNMCCVNALAASDFVLAPITPSEKTIERISPLLGRIKEVRASGVNPDLNMLGIVLNSTAGRILTTREEDMLLTLPDKCLDVFNNPVARFDTTIPHRVQIRAAGAGFCTPEDELAGTFEQLAVEFSKRLPGCCWNVGERKSKKKQQSAEGPA
jgi:cellulose biosynthesis protein BcsQ